MCEGIEGETSHCLFTWPSTKLSPYWQQPFQTCSGVITKNASFCSKFLRLWSPLMTNGNTLNYLNFFTVKFKLYNWSSLSRCYIYSNKFWISTDRLMENRNAAHMLAFTYKNARFVGAPLGCWGTRAMYYKTLPHILGRKFTCLLRNVLSNCYRQNLAATIFSVNYWEKVLKYKALIETRGLSRS